MELPAGAFAFADCFYLINLDNYALYRIFAAKF